MQLYWISLISTISLLLNVAAAAKPNILAEINEDSPIQPYSYDPKAPFERRNSSQATVWNVHKKSFGFHLAEKELCQEVWLCSTVAGLTEIGSLNLKTHKANSWCSEYTRFRPLEGTVTFGLKAGKPNDKGTTFVYPWTSAFLKLDEASSNYLLTVASKERDITGEVKEATQKPISINGLPLILTSSPYCFPIVQDDSGRPVSAVTIGEVELAFPSMRLKDAIHEKTTSVLVPTHIKKYRLSKSVKCPPIWLPEYESTGPNWMTRSLAVKQKAAYMLYHINNSGSNKDTPQARATFKLQIDDPSKCNWIRLCFFEKPNGELCGNPKMSLELLLAYKMFIGPDSDEARALEGDSDLLKLIRFHILYLPTQELVLTMSYGFASDEGAIQHHMHADHFNPIGQSQQYMTLARDGDCMARLLPDVELESPEMAGKQYLSFSDCSVVIPEEFEKFPGSEAVKYDDYHPGS